MGLHKMIEKPETLLELFKQYKVWAKSNPFKITDWVGGLAKEVEREKERALTMEGFENFVADIDGMPFELSQYFANRENRYSEFVPICSRIKASIRQDQVEGGLAGIYNPSITQRLNGLVEKQENKVQIEEHKITLNLG